MIAGESLLEGMQKYYNLEGWVANEKDNGYSHGAVLGSC